MTVCQHGFLKILTTGESGCGLCGSFTNYIWFSINITCSKKQFLKTKPVVTRHSETETDKLLAIGVTSAPVPSGPAPHGHRAVKTAGSGLQTLWPSWSHSDPGDASYHRMDEKAKPAHSVN